MTIEMTTRERLLHAAQGLFWARGYSNVSVRDIARAAGVDVALISRYFGSKMGLFDATQELIDRLDPDQFETPQDLVDGLVKICIDWPRDADVPSPLTHLLLNGNDPEVGDKVRAVYREHWQGPIEKIVGDPTRAAMVSAVLLGMNVLEKTVRLGGVADPTDPRYEPAFRKLFAAALAD